MQLDANSPKPIFLQLAEMVEENILSGAYPEETQIPSTTEIAVALKLNPATINRGINLLVEQGVVYKKRGVGMFVCGGAREKIRARRRKAFFADFLQPLLEEARSLGLSKSDVIAMLNGAGGEETNGRRSVDE